MQSYISEIPNKTIYNKLFYILRKKKISYTLESDSIKINNYKDGYNFIIYHENYKPQFMVTEESKDIILKTCEDINMKMDEYDDIQDIIYDIELRIKKENMCQKKIIKIKFNDFNEKLENKKQEFIKYQIPNKNSLFSQRACVEMLGDQVVKIFNNDNFNVNIDEFPNLKITLSNFTFNGSNDLNVIIDMKIDLNIFNQPPKINLSSNKILKDNILKIICELKPFSDIKSWSVKYSIYDSIVNIFNMINIYGETKNEYATDFDRLANDLEYLLSIQGQNISEEKLLKIFDKDFVVNSTDNNAKNNSKNDKWKKGTGYGHSGLSTWDIDSYIKCINEKKNNINIKFDNFINILHNEYIELNKFQNDEKVIQTIRLLSKYLENEEISNSNIILIADIIYTNYKLLNNSKYTHFPKLLELLKNLMDDNNIVHKLTENDNINTIISVNKTVSLDPFVNLFNDYLFVMYPEEFKKFHYTKLVNINAEKLQKIKKEFSIIKKSITANSEASIFFCVEKNNLGKIKFIISGPKDTPYDQGLYIFDMTLSNEYPAKPPLVHFSNNGGQRFNPNLYNCGKVCLSLLGTWSAQKGESWNSSTSTFFQILVSIQSQILIDEPYFNEPGHESWIGKANGIASSKAYNDNIRKYNLDYAINGLIEGVLTNNSPYPEFNYIIRNYFKFKKDRILDILNKWELEYTDKLQLASFKISKEKFIQLSNQL